MAIIARITAKFNVYYGAHPSKYSSTFDFYLTMLTSYAVLTMMVTNAVLGGIADTVAQTITAVRQRAVRKPGGVRDDDTFAIEIHELDKQNPLSSRELIPDSKALPPPFDFERLARFMGYGFMMAPVQLKWFQFLQKSFPITKASGLSPVLKRVACDQLIFAPAGMCISSETKYSGFGSNNSL
jgi:protein Mpv17